jgi:hypothetical protein
MPPPKYFGQDSKETLIKSCSLGALGTDRVDPAAFSTLCELMPRVGAAMGPRDCF